MRQTLESMLAPITARINAEKIEAKLKSEPKEKTFHEKELDRMAADPANGLHKAAIAVGKKNAEEFINAALDRHHKDHKANLGVFRDVYHMSPQKCEEDFIQKSCSDMKTREFEKRDPGYEQTVLRLYKPVGDLTPMKQRMVQLFNDAVQEKWRKQGYLHDEEFCKNAASEYCLKRNESDSQLRDFKLK